MEKQSSQGLLGSFNALKNGMLRLGQLYLRKARLQITEKITILLSTVAFAAVAAALVLVLFIFITIGVGHLLATSIAPHFAYLIVAGFYLILLVVACIFRRALFINPIARFMSRLIVEAPVDDDDNDGDPKKTSAKGHADPKDVAQEVDYDKLAEHIIKKLETENKKAEHESHKQEKKEAKAEKAAEKKAEKEHRKIEKAEKKAEAKAGRKTEHDQLEEGGEQ